MPWPLHREDAAQKPAVISLEKRWSHHATGSGYDRLADYLDARRVRRVALDSLPAKACDQVWRRLAGPGRLLFDYGLGDRLAEEKMFWLALATRAPIGHALYGDEQLDLLLRRSRWLRTRLVATFHLPSEQTHERFERMHPRELSRLAGAVVVSSREVPTFARWLGPEKVMFVPHGIDTTAFRAGSGNVDEQGPLRLLFVGLHMRDFDVAHRVADRCAACGIDVVFDAVLPSRHHGFFTGCDNVRRHSGISDALLLQMYQSADALFLPVTGATANNAVLEALACGTPVISTRIGGMPDYVDDSCGWLLPPADAEAAFRCVEALAANRALAKGRRAAARARAEQLAWPLVAARIMAGYARILAGRPFAA